jgi:hypothetical protein
MVPNLAGEASKFRLYIFAYHMDKDTSCTAKGKFGK